MFVHGHRLAALVILALAVVSCAGVSRHQPTLPSGLLDVRLDAGEADAALTILDKRASGAAITATDWDRLFATQGYRRLKEREEAMGRAFTDSAFREFLLSDTLLSRVPLLDRALPLLERLDVSGAAGRAQRYLPAGTPLRARLYLEIKPVTNSFVHTGSDSTPSIFLYVNPRQSAAQLENTVAHELHHIGVNGACRDQAPSHVAPGPAMLLRFLGAFAEGQAMLAAAGGPNVHPHAADDDTIKARWDRDVASAPAHIAELSRFFTAVLDGRISSADSVQRQAMTYFGVQGPWYTVGWLMASTIERELGHDALMRVLCEPTQFLLLYNAAARQENARGASRPLWDPGLLGRLNDLHTAS